MLTLIFMRDLEGCNYVELQHFENVRPQYISTPKVLDPIFIFRKMPQNKLHFFKKLRQGMVNVKKTNLPLEISIVTSHL